MNESMNRILALLICVVVAMFAIPVATAVGPPLIDQPVPGQAIVRLAPGVSLQTFLIAFNRQFPGAAGVDQVPDRPIHLISYIGSPVAVDALFHAQPGPLTGLIVWGELVYEDWAPEARTGSIWVAAFGGGTLFDSQYLRGLLGTPAAHQRSTGAGVTVAVLDTGIDATHPALAGSVPFAGINFITPGAGTGETLGPGGVAGGAPIDQAVGHGTFVAGLIKLIAPDAHLLPIVVLDHNGRGQAWALTRGMFYAIDHGVEVINLSLSSTYNSEAVQDAVDEAKGLGIVVAAAAGNLGHDEPREYPAMTSSALGVAATNHADIKADFSNFDQHLFISAPGDSAFTGPGVPIPNQSVYSTIPGGGYAVWEGTSAAAPLVAGVAALVRAQHPDWAPSLITYGVLRAALEDSAVSIDALNPLFEGQLGAGRLSAAAAVALGPIAPQLGDLNGDGIINTLDLGTLLSSWGAVHASADLNGDGIVNTLDLGLLLANWTL